MSRPLLARGALRLTLLSVDNLRLSPQQLYVRLSVGRQMHHSEPVHGSSRSINATFSFTISGSGQEEEQYLRIEVRDDSLAGNNKEVGSAVVPLSEVLGWSGVQRIDVMPSNGVQICGTVLLSADFTADNSSAPPPMYPALSSQPAYNPAFYSSSPSPAEPPPPYQRIDPYAPQQQLPQQYSPGSGYNPQSFPPPQYSPQPHSQPPQYSPQPAAVPAQPASFRPAASQSPAWATQPPPSPQPVMPMPVATPVMQQQTVVLPSYGSDVKDPRHQHVLRHLPTMYNGTGFACNLCSREYNSNAFHCAVCNFDLCPTCFVRGQQSAASAAAPTRDVRHQHPLHWQRLTGRGYARGFRCDGCGEAGRDQAWHCQQCSFDLHNHCLRRI